MAGNGNTLPEELNIEISKISHWHKVGKLCRDIGKHISWCLPMKRRDLIKKIVITENKLFWKDHVVHVASQYQEGWNWLIKQEIIWIKIWSLYIMHSPTPILRTVVICREIFGYYQIDWYQLMSNIRIYMQTWCWHGATTIIAFLVRSYNEISYDLRNANYLYLPNVTSDIGRNRISYWEPVVFNELCDWKA